MCVLSALTLLMLCAASVHCSQQGPECPLKQSHPGVLALNMGSEVILGCRGDVTVDGAPLIMGTKHKERLKTKGDVTGHLNSPGTTEIHNRVIENFEKYSTEKYNIETATGTYAEVSEVTANPTMTSENKQMGHGEVLQTANQSIKPKSWSGVTEEGGAFSVTMEMGLSTERSTNNDYEDYEDMVEGLRVTRSIRRQARWTWNGLSIRDGVEYGGILRLPALQLTDSGNYSCYRRGNLVSSVKISVGIPPERPSLSCYKKSHNSKIHCEWKSKQPIIPQPQCYLLLRKKLDPHSQVNCSYSRLHSRCWCAFPSIGTDRNHYTARLCVTNTAGNATSPPFHYIPKHLIKPNPPARVVVEPVIGEPHTLKVSWSLPSTWRRSYFFTLIFQLRYRPLNSKEYQQVRIDDAEQLWLISDALPHIKYEIQIQAKDEFDGQWSEWTSPVYAHTWTGPETTAAPDNNTSLMPVWISEGSGGSEDEDIKPVDKSDDVKWIHLLWVVGICLFITICILSVYSLRHRMLHVPKKKKESVSSACSCSSPSPLLQQPLMIQGSSHQEGEREGIYLHNVDYFFPSL